MKLITTVTAENSWSVWGFSFCWVQNVAKDSDLLCPSLLFWNCVRCLPPDVGFLCAHNPNVGFENMQSAAQCQSSLAEELLELKLQLTLGWN